MPNKMGRVPSLGGKPSMQAMMGAEGSMRNQPLRSPGKPAKSLKGKPATRGTTQTAKKPRGKGVPSFKQGTVKGIKRKAVANLNKKAM